MNPSADRSAAEPRLSALEQPVVEHYERKLAAHGATARGMDWRDEASQELRFAVLCSVCSLAGRSVHEVGAGAGHLLDFLRARAIAANYSGSDLSRLMVETARSRHPGVRFAHRDVLASPGERFDVVLASGIFHVKLANRDGEWRAFIEQAVRRMYESCRVAIAFNLMTDRVDYRSETLYYANPGEILEFCTRNLSRFVAVRHDYGLHEFTVHVYRDAVG